MPVNATIAVPKSPGSWVDQERCLCGQTYAKFRAGVGFDLGARRVRDENGGGQEEGAGGFRSRRPVLHAMRVLKLEAWYLEHHHCGANICANRLNGTCTENCQWC